MSAADAPFIPRRGKQDEPLGFWSLRQEGLAAVQALSGAHWTDYNLHDPGVTILEQACYALTGLVYRADFPVADHLAGEDGGIDLEGHALHPAEVVFPCRPTTPADYRQLLLDHVSGLDEVAVEPAAGGPPGRWRVELRVAPGQPEQGRQAVRDALALLRANRNLGEDFEHAVTLVEDRWCTLHAEIEIGGPRDAADVLAEVYFFCETRIAAPAMLQGTARNLAEGDALEDVFSGPAVRNGRVLPAATGEQLFIADLMTGLKAVDGVQEVRWLGLQVEGGETLSVDTLARRGAGWALRLRVPADGGEVRLLRRGSRVDPPPDRVFMKYQDLRAAASGARLPAGAMSARGPRPRGNHRPALPHSPLQDQFPAVYGINAYGLEPGASRQEKAWAWQLKAYLALFDQAMAHSGAQLAHIRELFAVREPERQTYWWQMLDDDVVPGLRSHLYTAAPQQVEQEVYRPTDNFLERKSRLLDYLLSLHGESFPQNSLRHFPSGYAPAELEARLFENKLALLQDILRFSRDRAAGFDDSRPAWDAEANTCGLQRRVGLVLGYAHTHTRSLVEPMQRHGLEPVATQLGRASAGRHASRPHGLQRLALDLDAGAQDQAGRNTAQLHALAGGRVDAALTRCAAFADRYWITPAGQGRCELYTGPDEHGAFWRLGAFADEAAARGAASAARNRMLHINSESGGLFVLEHLLLRPVGTSAAHQQLRQQSRVPADAFDMRLTVVLPGWTVRGHEPNFRALAQETVQLNAPAHLQARCLWLEFDAMRKFEQGLRNWLQARAQWCGQDDSEPVRMRMNHAACELLRLLYPPPGQGDAA